MPYFNCYASGEKVLILSHGQPSSGKTCTMFGFNRDVGVFQSSVRYLLDQGNIFIAATEIRPGFLHGFDLMSKSRKILSNGNDSEWASIENLANALSIDTYIRQNRNLENHLILKLKVGNSTGMMAFADMASSDLSELNIAMMKTVRGEKVTFNELWGILQGFFPPSGKLIVLYHVVNDEMISGLEDAPLVSTIGGCNK